MTKEAISTERALKLALEALLGWGKGFPDNWGDLDTEAITALREALTSVPDSASKAIEQPAQIDWEAVAADQAMTIGLLKAVQPAQPQQEPVAYRSRIRNRDGQVITAWVVHLEKSKKPSPRYEIESLYTTPPARKPLTHEQRVDLLAKFEAHKNEWHAPAILIDMVEAAHGIKEKNT